MPMNTDVKYFHSGMIGAPAELSYATPGTVIAMFDACLVNGFGLVTATSAVVADGLCTLTFPAGHSFEKYVVAEIAGATPSELNGQHRIISTTTNTATFGTTLADQTASGTITAKVAPAGWEKAFSDTNVGCYRSLNVASTKSFFRVSDAAANSYTYTVDGYLDMTDAATGAGVFKATNRFFTKQDTTSGTRRWFIIANSSFVYVGAFYGSPSSTNGGGFNIACFGDIKSAKSNDAYRAYIRGHFSANTTSQSEISSTSPSLNTNGIFARDYTGIGGARTGCFAIDGRGATSYGTAGLPYPNPTDYSLRLIPVLAFESTSSVASALRGEAPGLFASDQNIVGRICAASSSIAFLDDISAMPGAVMACVPVFYSAYQTVQWYPIFIDIGRAWGN